MIVRLAFTLIAMFIAYKLYQRMLKEKRCTACGKRIGRQAAVCHHCNTLQESAELVQATVAGSSDVNEAELVDQPRNKRRTAVYVGLAAILIGAAAAALMWFQSIA